VGLPGSPDSPGYQLPGLPSPVLPGPSDPGHPLDTQIHQDQMPLPGTKSREKPALPASGYRKVETAPAQAWG
jgi:hypothetical protein